MAELPTDLWQPLYDRVTYLDGEFFSDEELLGQRARQRWYGDNRVDHIHWWSWMT